MYPEINNNPNITTPQIIRDMVDKNIISPVIEQKTSVGTSINNLSVTAGSKTEFNWFPTETGSASIIMPEKSFIWETNNQYVLREQVLRYTKNGKPQEIVQDGAHTTVYLWGYKYQYPVAVIQNATYQEVKTALGNGVIESIAAKAEPSSSDLQAINNLRGIMSNSLISSYTYKPHIGITSMTQPSGATVNYVYDSFGRLKYVKDIDGNTLNENQYHYAQ